MVQRVVQAATAAGLWDELDTDRLLLDAEVLPWSAKAEPLIRDQYASVAAAAGAALRDRNLGRKRGLALREQALGLAALDLLAERAAAWRVHQLVFAVLACESEPVDPRL